jgi:hypothetical protein
VTVDTGWAQLEQAPRRRAGDLRLADVPRDPGVYAWFRDGRCVYVGKASSLRRRLSTHVRTSPDLSRSTLRATVAVRELTITRATARARPSVITPEQASVINRWLEECDIAWVTCTSPRTADELERLLRRERMPELNRV